MIHKRVGIGRCCSFGTAVALLVIFIGVYVQPSWAQRPEDSRESLGDFIKEQMQKYRERFTQEADTEEQPEERSKEILNTLPEETPSESPAQETVLEEQAETLLEETTHPISIETPDGPLVQEGREEEQPEILPEEKREGAPGTSASDSPAQQGDDEDSEGRPYLTAVQEKIHDQWVIPKIAGGGSFVTVVSFRLFRSGVVQKVTIEKTSGSSIFDQAGRQAILDAAPFSPFPSSMTERFFDTTFTFKAHQ